MSSETEVSDIKNGPSFGPPCTCISCVYFSSSKSGICAVHSWYAVQIFYSSFSSS